MCEDTKKDKHGLEFNNKEKQKAQKIEELFGL